MIEWPQCRQTIGQRLATKRFADNLKHIKPLHPRCLLHSLGNLKFLSTISNICAMAHANLLCIARVRMQPCMSCDVREFVFACAYGFRRMRMQMMTYVFDQPAWRFSNPTIRLPINHVRPLILSAVASDSVSRHL